MKRKDTDEIRAMNMDCTRVVFSYSHRWEDVEPITTLKKQIDIFNENCVKLHCNKQQFMLVNVETYTWTNDDGVFVKRETLEEALEVYPASI